VPLVDFLLLMIELFSLGVTAEVVRVNIDWKSAFLKGQFPIFRCRTQRQTGC